MAPLVQGNRGVRGVKGEWGGVNQLLEIISSFTTETCFAVGQTLSGFVDHAIVFLWTAVLSSFSLHALFATAVSCTPY